MEPPFTVFSSDVSNAGLDTGWTIEDDSVIMLYLRSETEYSGGISLGFEVSEKFTSTPCLTKIFEGSVTSSNLVCLKYKFFFTSVGTYQLERSQSSLQQLHVV